MKTAILTTVAVLITLATFAHSKGCKKQCKGKVNTQTGVRQCYNPAAKSDTLCKMHIKAGKDTIKGVTMF